jgi:hypothetical protein
MTTMTTKKKMTFCPRMSINIKQIRRNNRQTVHGFKQASGATIAICPEVKPSTYHHGQLDGLARVVHDCMELLKGADCGGYWSAAG